MRTYIYDDHGIQRPIGIELLNDRSVKEEIIITENLPKTPEWKFHVVLGGCIILLVLMLIF